MNTAGYKPIGTASLVSNMQSHSVMAIHDPLQLSGMLVEIYIAANLNLTISLHMSYIIQQNFKAFEKFLNLKDI